MLSQVSSAESPDQVESKASQRNGKIDTARLEGIAREISKHEGVLMQLRSDRDAEIKRLVSRGLSERAAARAATVSPSYAHRAAVHGRLARRVRG